MGRIHKTMTPAAEAANRANGAESGGPASDPGRERSKMNALKHGRFAERPDPVELLLAQPSPAEEAERQAVRAELVECYQPPDAFAEQAAEELADLRFELRRLERVKEALWQRERELLELEQRRRARAVQHRVQEAADHVSHEEVQKTGLMQAPDSPGKYREMGVALEWAKVEMDRRDFRGAWSTLATVYGDLSPSWRGQKLLYLLHLCEKAAAEADTSQEEPEEAEKPEEKAQREVNAQAEGKSQPEAKAQRGRPMERRSRQLLCRFRTMLADELQEVREKLELCESEQGPLSAAGQAVRLLEATSSRKWGWVRSQENFLRRSIDRKLRILIELRRDRAKAERSLRGLAPSSGGGPPQPPGPPMGHPPGGSSGAGARIQTTSIPVPGCPNPVTPFSRACRGCRRATIRLESGDQTGSR